MNAIGSLQNLRPGLGDCKRQSGTELEGRNQVNTQDLEPHFKEGSGRWNVDKLSNVGSLHPSKLSFSPDMQ